MYVGRRAESREQFQLWSRTLTIILYFEIYCCILVK